MRLYLVHAWDCPGPFYMGWGLYVCPIIDGKAVWCKRFVSDGGSLWLRDNVGRVRRLAEKHGAPMPEHARWSDRVAEAFGAAFPHGVYVRGNDASDWSLEGTEVNHDPAVLAAWPQVPEGR